MEKYWTVYILLCGDGTLYTGITDDLQRRLHAHASGRGGKYTRGRGPLKLCYQELLPDKGAALRREAEIKRLRRCEKLTLIEKNRAKIGNDLKSMHYLCILESRNGGSTIRREEGAQE